MQKTLRFLIVILFAAGCAFAAWWYTRPKAHGPELVLYGNVDFRQTDLAFDNTERIVAMLVEEGERVRAGQVLARVDSARLVAQVAEAEANVAAQTAAVARLRNGSRPEEVAQAAANVQAAEAELENARAQHDRLSSIASKLEGRAVSKQSVEDAEALVRTAGAKLEVARRTHELAVAGPRSEDIAQAEAQARAGEARLAYLAKLLEGAELVAPIDAVVRSRSMEVGELASPQRTVYSLAATDPKWVRAYVSGSDLGRVRPGTPMSVRTDSFPDRPYEGWVGFLSPVAEFTPKTVQTEELRTSLVYEVRVHVKDPHDELRLGMPATVTLAPQSTDASRSAPPTLGHRDEDR